jgi:hypothetical protein
MSLGRDQICAGVTRYLRRYLQISSQISADNRRTQIARSRSCSLRSSHSLQLRYCLLPPPSRRHLAPSSSRPPPPWGITVVFGGGGGVSLLSLLFAFVLPTSSRRCPASSSSGWGKTTGPPRPPPAMSFPSGDVVVTPFVGADDEIDGTVAPPQG